MSSNLGDRPKRLRGYYRALKRQEPWAVKLSKKSGLSFWLDWHYSPHMSYLVYSANPFLSLVKKSANFMGKYYPIPIVFGEKDEDENS